MMGFASLNPSYELSYELSARTAELESVRDVSIPDHTAGCARMAALRFRCPYSNRPIDSGIDIELAEALKMRDLPIRIRCPYCDCIHDGTVADGELRDAA